jgi:hypothetical protein
LFAANCGAATREHQQHILEISLYQQTSRWQSVGTTRAALCSRAGMITTSKIGRVKRFNLRIR